MRSLIFIVLTMSVMGCGVDSDKSSPLPPIVKCKPPWETRTFLDWRKRECKAEDKNDCSPMGHATFLVEFVHDGCRTFKGVIDSQAAIGQGYASSHGFVLINASSDALTHATFDHGHYKGAPCQVSLFDDTPKPDRKNPNEDQWFTSLCEDATSSVDSECRSQLSEKCLYTP